MVALLNPALYIESKSVQPVEMYILAEVVLPVSVRRSGDIGLAGIVLGCSGEKNKRREIRKYGRG